MRAVGVGALGTSRPEEAPKPGKKAGAIAGRIAIGLVAEVVFFGHGVLLPYSNIISFLKLGVGVHGLKSMSIRFMREVKTG